MLMLLISNSWSLFIRYLNIVSAK